MNLVSSMWEERSRELWRKFPTILPAGVDFSRRMCRAPRKGGREGGVARLKSLEKVPQGSKVSCF